MSKHASAEEKLRLIKLYYESGQTIEELHICDIIFCRFAAAI